jgi:indole-3-glycerol phosphate synthase
MNILDETLASTRRAVDRRKRVRSLADLQRRLPNRPDERAFLRALHSPGVSVIAEFKRQWPSAHKRELPVAPDVRTTVGDYQRAGASAVSVLTEKEGFGGSHDDLRVARESCTLPILDKDFIIDEYQVYEAADAGADAILLIGAAFTSDPSAFEHLYGVARGLHLDVLVEVRNEDELDQAMKSGADLIGINNRDLTTLNVDLETSHRLVSRIPETADIAIVSESGLKESRAISALDERVSAVLVGAALMTAPDRCSKCREFVEAGMASAGRVHHVLA